MRHKWQGIGDRLLGSEFLGLGTGSSSSLGTGSWGAAGCFGDRLLGTGPRGLGTGCGPGGLGEFSVGLCGFVPALAGRLGGRMSFRAMREGVGCSPSMLAPARSRCRWVAFGDRLPGVSLGTGSSSSLGTGYLEATWGTAGTRDRLVEGTGCSRPVPLRFGVGMGLFATAWSGCACGLCFGHDSPEGVGPLFHGRTLQAH